MKVKSQRGRRLISESMRGRPPWSSPSATDTVSPEIVQFSRQTVQFDVFKSLLNDEVNGDLRKVYELQRKEQIHVCMLLGGLDQCPGSKWLG